ncbi:MAG TPA: hypothetical protein VF796_22090 [Humisphaera sp.]
MSNEPTNPHLLICNGAPTTGIGRRGPEWSRVAPKRLATFGTGSNVTLRITDITDQVLRRLPPLVEDLVELSALVYAADQWCLRTPGVGFEYGTMWHRTFRFEVAVREPDFWNRPDVLRRLRDTLGFLSDDHYEFAFTGYKDPPDFAGYLDYQEPDEPAPAPHEVMLFSGGLDSLTGAAEQVIVGGRRVALVSHKPVDTLATKQKDLVTEIRRRARERHPGVRPMHVAVKANKEGQLTLDNTQRSRSFLYASLAAAVAEQFGLDAIHFYENGVVSINLPLCAQEVGSRATRTTHPQVLAGFAQLFTMVLGRDFEVRNKYLWATKEDVLRRLLRTEQADLARQSFSCVHTRLIMTRRPHCGLCSQCLSRWVASLGAGYGENDPSAGYDVDVLTGERKRDADRILAERYIGWARRVERMTSIEEFNLQFAAELGRVHPFVDEPEDSAMGKLFELHREHARQVGEAIKRPMMEHVHELWSQQLPNTCALAYACSPTLIGDAGQHPATEQKADARPPLPAVRLQGIGKPVYVREKLKKALGKAQYAVVESLVKAGDVGLSKDSLEAICGDARGVLRRLARDEDWGSVIHLPGKPGVGYRIG